MIAFNNTNAGILRRYGNTIGQAEKSKDLCRFYREPIRLCLDGAKKAYLGELSSLMG